MKVKICILLAFVFLSSCHNQNKKKGLQEGIWRAELQVLDGHKLPFNFEVQKGATDKYVFQLMNAEELISVDEITFVGDSISIKIPVFEGLIKGVFTEHNIEGSFHIESLDRTVPFTAMYGVEDRFITTKRPAHNVSGIWETHFSPNTSNAYVGKGVFVQQGQKVTGTFRTTTGDYRYLEGVVEQDSLKLSTFDGAHAFLFHAKVSDSTMSGTFYSGNHYKTPFEAVRNEGFVLPSPDALTFIKEGFEKLAFTFPDTDGTLISLDNPLFTNKVVIVQLMGTWCPNCLDETKYLVSYLNTHSNQEIAVVGLAFEAAKTKEKAFAGIERLKKRLAVPYPILLAQYGSYDKEKAQQKLPMLNHVLSYPTTIILDKKGAIRKIHTGFNGPATGQTYIDFKTDFDSLIQELVAEK